MTGHQKRSHEQSDDTISDQACTRCRERKIRCGRELPQCNNCERDDSVTCTYQNPTKRVNHLKSLFDSVNRLNDRLQGIESHLGRLSINMAQNLNQDHSRPTSSSHNTSASEDPNENDDETRSGTHSPHSDGSGDLYLLNDSMDTIHYYHGPSSLYVLCKRFESLIINTRHPDHGTPVRDRLQNICERAGTLEPFPAFGGKPVINLLSRQQANTVIDRFFQRVNCATDVFVKGNLLTQIERIYSGSTETGDDVWAICLQVITVLVWGTELSSQHGNGLFGDFARSFLPSRTAMVHSNLLTTPKLINVQTLILLSVAAQQFDPPGWAEFIFSSACGLARTMGLHRMQLFPHEANTYDAVERAKVIQSLYIRDKSLCTTRGAVSWLPTHDCSIAHRLSVPGIERLSHYGSFQLAKIQDQVYGLAHTAPSRISRPSKSHIAKVIKSVEQQLCHYERAFHVLDGQASSYDSHRAIATLEFLTTRIIALQYGCEQRHAEQVRADAKTSCLLLLIAHGDQDRQVVDTFDTLAFQTENHLTGRTDLAVDDSGTASSTSILDAFSVPAFFLLLEDLIRYSPSDERADIDLCLLRKVSSCYSKITERMQSNSYYRRVAWIFEQLLTIYELITNIQTKSNYASFASDDPMSHMVMSLDTQLHDEFDISPSHTVGNGSSLSVASQLTTNTPFPWDLGSTIPSSLGLYAPFASAGMGDPLESDMMDPFSQLRNGSPNESSTRSLSLSDISPGQSTTRKRPRTHENSEIPHVM